MSRQFWSETMWWATADGTAVANTVTETIIFPNITIDANYLADGRLLRIRAFGKLSTTLTPTMQFALRWGGVAGTILWQSEALTMGSGVVNVNWELEIYLQVRSNGATGTVVAMGELWINTGTTTSIGQVVSVSGFDAPAPVTVDLTAATALALTAKWSAASASNTLTGMIYTGEALN
jgi:hypothetical protein